MKYRPVSPSFEPIKGNTMAYIQNNEICLVSTDTWEQMGTLKNTKLPTNVIYTVCRYSRCGRYLAAGTASGHISVWNVRTGTVLNVDAKGNNDAQGITAIDWNPAIIGELAYTDNTGQLGTVTEVVGDADRHEQIGEDITDDAATNNDDLMFDGSEKAPFIIKSMIF